MQLTGKGVLAPADDGLHADAKLVINGGEISIISSYEGLEAAERYFWICCLFLRT